MAEKATAKTETKPRLKVAVFGPDEPVKHGATAFEFDGKPYAISSKVGPAAQMRYMRNLRKHNPLYALTDLMEHVLGEQAMDVLTGYDDLTPDEMRAVSDIVEQYVVGGDPLDHGGAEGS
jgi:hypothetical protein